MATKKKATKKVTRKVSSVVASEAMTSEMSADTKTIIVVLLLIFVYPVGIIFMWIWTKWWPQWVKILISFPFILAIFGILFGFLITGMFMRRTMEQDNMNHMFYQRNIQPQQNHMYITPAPTSVPYSNY